MTVNVLKNIFGLADESFIKTYGIVHPSEQWAGRRNIEVGPYFSRQEELDAMFFQARTWERPQWYGANADLVDRYDLKEKKWNGTTAGGVQLQSANT